MFSKQDGQILFWVQYAYAMGVVYANECKVAEKRYALPRRQTSCHLFRGMSADDILEAVLDPASMQSLTNPKCHIIMTQKERSYICYRRARHLDIERFRSYGRMRYQKNRMQILANAKKRYQERKHNNK